MQPRELDVLIFGRGHVKIGGVCRVLMVLSGCAGAILEIPAMAQEQESSTGVIAAQKLAETNRAEAQQYDIRYGPLSFQIGAGLGFAYTDNVFYTSSDRAEDYLISVNTKLAGLWQLSELNTLNLSVILGYDRYIKNTELNVDAPFVNPDSELAFNLFVGDVHIRLHDRFGYQQSLFINSFTGNEPFFNFNNVGTFERYDNKVGVDATWALNKAVLSVGYDHENFISTTSSFEYLNRASEWFNASAGYLAGDHVQTGLEGRVSLHQYDEQTILSDNWRARVGPFVELTSPAKISFRTGGGFETAQYGADVTNSDYDSYYAYARVSQETRLFSHSFEAGRELLLGDNANNMRTVYVRYAISLPVTEHVVLGANASVNLAKEYGGPSGFDEKFTFYEGGLSAGYQIAKHWRTDVAYDYRLKESDLPLRDYGRNQVTVNVQWTF